MQSFDDQYKDELENVVSTEAPEEKLTHWKKEPTIEDLKANLKDAEPTYREAVEKINNYLDALHCVREHAPTPKKGRSKVQPKVIRRQNEWQYASLSEPFLSNNNLFKVSPVTWEDKSAAIQNELLLNTQFSSHINKTAFIDALIRALVDEGTAILKTSWVVEYGSVTETEYKYRYTVVPPSQDESYQQYAQQIMEFAQMRVEEPDSFAQLEPGIQEAVRASVEYGELYHVEVVSAEDVTKEKAIKNHPMVEVCDFKEIYVDPTCKGIVENANFVIHKFASSLSDLKKAGIYKNLDTINVEKYSKEAEDSQSSTYESKEIPERSTDFKFSDTPRVKLNVYEYWGYWDIDGDGEVEPIVATWVDDVLIRLEENPFPDGRPPFVFIQYMPNKNSVYGDANAELLIDNQYIVGAMTRGIVDIFGRSAVGQIAYRVGALSNAAKAAKANGDDFEIQGATSNIQQDISVMTPPAIPGSIFDIIMQQNADAEAISGIKAFSTGGGITGANLGNTAAGVNMTMTAASKREFGILRRISEGLKIVARKFIGMNAVLLDEEEIIRITNAKYVAIRKDDLEGNFDLAIGISTKEADEAKTQKLAMMLQTIGNTMDASMTQMILAEIARLQEAPDLAHAIATYQPQPDPYQEQMKQLELQYKQAEIQLLQAQAQERAADSQYKTAKIPNEQAKAQSTALDAQKKQVDIQEEYSGVHHNRAMELQQNKAQADAYVQGAKLKSQEELAKIKAALEMSKQRNDLIKMSKGASS